MRTRCGESADIEQQVQRLLQPERMVVGQGMRLAPLPGGRVVAQCLAQVGQAGLPGAFHRVAAATMLAAAMQPPPGRLGVGGQARQGGIDDAGADQHLEPGIAQFVMHGCVRQVVEQLVEQRGADRVQRIVAIPAGQLFDQLFFLIARGHFSQDSQQRCQGAWAIAAGCVEL
ncbi:hypothetical protein D3C79_791910 [compost metagenome]